MPEYSYVAYDNAGKQARGRIEASSVAQAADDLARRGLIVIDLNESPAEKKVKGGKSLMSLQDHEQFCRSLGAYLRTGIPLVDSLKLLERQKKKGPLPGVISYLRQSIQEGRRFGAALRESGRFQESLCAMVESGEKSGRLVEILAQAADLFNLQSTLQRKLRSAMTYPIVMMLVGTGVVAFLVTFVVPKVADLFSEMGQQLPLATRILLAISGFLQEWGIWLLIVLLVVWLVTRKRGTFRNVRLPFFSGFADKTMLSLLTSSLAALLESGVPLVQVLLMVAPLDKNPKRWEVIADKVRAGVRFEKALDEDGGFPEDMVYSVRVGELGGDLAPSLERVSVNYWEDAKAAMDRFSSLIEPVMVLSLACVVGFVVVAVLLPIFDVSTFIR